MRYLSIADANLLLRKQLTKEIQAKSDTLLVGLW